MCFRRRWGIDGIPPPSFLCLSQESNRRASARRKDSFQPKDLGWLDPCDRHRDEGGGVGRDFMTPRL
ncbi:hypothetical protein DXT96_11525 [Agrobacterium sp. ICMP 6402]|nr:hypothetical protein [Agrobacterium sp. ICMP 6402]